MHFYAHTSESKDGTPLTETSGKWQPLARHLRNVADKAKELAEPVDFALAAEAELAGLLHDLGKYAERFQARTFSSRTNERTCVYTREDENCIARHQG